MPVLIDEVTAEIAERARDADHDSGQQTPAPADDGLSEAIALLQQRRDRLKID